MAFKPYRVNVTGTYHYFLKLEGARAFIRNFGKVKGKVIPVPLTIERINPEKFKAGPKKYTYFEVYDEIEDWIMTADGWKTKRLQK